MNEEFLNVYIEMNSKKIEELIRGELLLQTKLALAEKLIMKLTEENKKLKEDLEKYSTAEETTKPKKEKDNSF